MAHFNVEESSPTPEAKGLQESKGEEVQQTEEEIKAKENRERRLIDRELNNGTNASPSQHGESSGSLYSLLLLIQSSALSKMNLELPTQDERDALKDSAGEIEKIYNTTRFLNPIVKLIVITVAPFVRQWDKLALWYKQYKSKKAESKG